MSNSEDYELTDFARFFLEPSNTTHRQYEALRAYFVEHLPSAETAKRFGYTPGSFRVLCHEFRQNPDRELCLALQKGQRSAPKSDPLVVAHIRLSKQHLSSSAIAHDLELNGQ